MRPSGQVCLSQSIGGGSSGVGSVLWTIFLGYLLEEFNIAISALIIMGVFVVTTLPIVILFFVYDIPEVPSEAMELAVQRHFAAAKSSEEKETRNEQHATSSAEVNTTANGPNTVKEDAKSTCDSKLTLWQLQKLPEVILVQIMLFTLSFAGAGQFNQLGLSRLSASLYQNTYIVYVSVHFL